MIVGVKESMHPVYSVIVPCFNEQECLRETHNRLGAVMRGMKEPYEILYVNDGSGDQTPAILNALAQEDSHVRVLHFAGNFGHQIAVSAGLDYAAGDAMVIIDADLQDPPEIIPLMAEKWRAGAQVVYGKRRSRKGETRFKEFTAKVYYRVLKRLAGKGFPEDSGDFRLVDRRVADVVRKMPEHARYLRGMFAWAGFKQEALLYDRDRRFAGKTHYSLKKMLRLAANGVVSFSDKPLVWSLWLGALWLIVGTAFLIALLLSAALGGGASGLAVPVLICMAAGSLHITLGILGAYLARVYEEARGRPLYIVADTKGFEPRTEPAMRQKA